ncbi:DUF3306 domain-containing protein [Phaeobacter sp. HF9A]|uniref:DUF3306 domain-containing protein n=1 Tax=Phaeobacter sp. HF9A TaxID=2721561 RepID=UPI001430CD79|nr:DUF3306 domain-containing protein [Phaeobacter sp. HF9A]NIZ13759.1 DUF3306 domain-containing protein [Phaeobacter sp. HF9A]
MSARNFWSRRRAAVEAEELAEARALAEAEVAEREAALAERDDADILAELELPDPDTLGEGDDFKVFLSKAVPARIKARALRRLWASNPVLANVDGLIDYGEDFTDAAMAVENIQTAYQVGKGMTAHVEELARQAEQEAAEAAGEAETPEANDAPETDLDDATGRDEAESLAQDVAQADRHVLPPNTDDTPAALVEGDLAEDDLALAPPPRRMRFAFDSAGETL